MMVEKLKYFFDFVILIFRKIILGKVIKVDKIYFFLIGKYIKFKMIIDIMY